MGRASSFSSQSPYTLRQLPWEGRLPHSEGRAVKVSGVCVGCVCGGKFKGMRAAHCFVATSRLNGVLAPPPSAEPAAGWRQRGDACPRSIYPCR